MGAMKENPRNNVVSIRINDEERKTLLSICRRTNKSVSTMMREIMSEICAKAEMRSQHGLMN